MNYKGFHHLTWNDRLTIEKMLKVRTAKAKIAEALGVSVRNQARNVHATEHRLYC